MTGRQHVIAWANADQQALIRDALNASSLRLAAIGSDDLDDAEELSRAFGVERDTELRSATHRPDVGMLWMLAPRCLSDDECRVLEEQSIRTLCAFPPIHSISGAWHRAGARLAPMFLDSTSFRVAGDLLEPFGERRLLHVFMGCGAGEGTTLARLFDAMMVVHRLLGEAETVTASIALPALGQADCLDQVRGSMTAHVRCAGGECASLAVTDASGCWRRSMAVIGEGGMMTLDDSGFQWRHCDGGVAAEHHVPPPHTAGSLFGQQAARWARQADSGDVPPDLTAVLAMCEAARLSCLTGQGEHPAQVMEMLSKP